MWDGEETLRWRRRSLVCAAFNGEEKKPFSGGLRRRRDGVEEGGFAAAAVRMQEKKAVRRWDAGEEWSLVAFLERRRMEFRVEKE